MIRPTVLCVILGFSLIQSLQAQSINQSLEGQLTALASEIRELYKVDRGIAGRKLRLDRVSSSGMPDANFDQHIESGISTRLADIIDNASKLLLKLEYSYLESETKTNAGLRVIQITAKVLENGRVITKKQTEGALDNLAREVNNSTDIVRMVGATMAPPKDLKDSNDSKKTAHQVRLKAVEEAFESPKFEVVNSTRVVAPGQTNYAVELRKRLGGNGNSLPTKPVNLSGLAFAEISVSDTYEIVVFNYDSQNDAVARIEIDGLDAVNTFNSDVDAQGNPMKYPGYFIPRAKNGTPGEHVVAGWMYTVKPGNDNVFQFVVNELGKGAASAKNVRGKTGVITVSFFAACDLNETLRGRNFGETGQGKPMKVDYSLKPVQVASEPVSIVSIRYSRSPKD